MGVDGAEVVAGKGVSLGSDVGKSVATGAGISLGSKVGTGVTA